MILMLPDVVNCEREGHEPLLLLNERERAHLERVAEYCDRRRQRSITERHEKRLTIEQDPLKPSDIDQRPPSIQSLVHLDDNIDVPSRPRRPKLHVPLPILGDVHVLLRPRPGRLGDLLDELLEVDGGEDALAARSLRLGRVGDLGEFERVVEDLAKAGDADVRNVEEGLCGTSLGVAGGEGAWDSLSFVRVAGAETSLMSSIWEPMPWRGVRSSCEI